MYFKPSGDNGTLHFVNQTVKRAADCTSLLALKYCLFLGSAWLARPLPSTVRTQGYEALDGSQNVIKCLSKQGRRAAKAASFDAV